LLPRQ
jgi:hypothetical protein